MNTNQKPVLIMPTWPRGFCPLHAFTDVRCTSFCLPVRVEFATEAARLQRFWKSKAGEAALRDSAYHLAA